jgi:ABC-type transport system involved in cytochrome bd biosynthesis fused ATPase/permease subunit
MGASKRGIDQSDHAARPVTLVDVMVETANGESSPLSITIATGDRIHLYHPDACLRTRVAETINGIRRPVSGRILHSEKDRTGFDPAWVRRHHAHISADLALPSGSVEMAMFGATLANEERRRDVLGRVGLAEVLDRLPLGLSTPIIEDDTWLSPDTRLRLLLARALISDPTLTIIDGAIDLVSAGLRHEAGEILREWPGSGVITSRDPRPIVPGSRVWRLEK